MYMEIKQMVLSVYICSSESQKSRVKHNKSQILHVGVFLKKILYLGIYNDCSHMIIYMENFIGSVICMH